jgi:hypothetical protein
MPSSELCSLANKPVGSRLPGSFFLLTPVLVAALRTLRQVRRRLSKQRGGSSSQYDPNRPFRLVLETHALWSAVRRCAAASALTAMLSKTVRLSRHVLLFELFQHWVYRVESRVDLVPEKVGRTAVERRKTVDRRRAVERP